MDENDVYFIDGERNAIVPRPGPTQWRPAARPPAQPWYRPWPIQQRPPYYPPQPQRPIVIVQRPQSLLTGLDIGEIVERGVNILAAMQSLPDAPTVTGEPTTDVGNMIKYQEALSEHAKTDERVRAFGGLAAQVAKVMARNAQQRVSSVPGLNFGGFGIGG